MNTRIRYGRPNESGVMESRRVFVTGNGQQVKASLDTVTKTYAVKDVLSGEVLASGGDTVNLSVLKLKTKQALRDLGCDFAEENRKERTTGGQTL